LIHHVSPVALSVYIHLTDEQPKNPGKHRRNIAALMLFFMAVLNS